MTFTDQDLLFELEGVPKAASHHLLGADRSGSSWLPVLDEVYKVLGQEAPVIRKAVTSVDAAVGAALPQLKNQRDRLRFLSELLSHHHGFYVRLRTGLGAGSLVDCMQQLRHTFLKVQLEPTGPEVLVDPYFRDQFRIGFKDPAYDAFLEDVPEVFVGTHSMLAVVVHAISRELERALAHQYVQPPPWREQANILSKWAPTNFKDEHYGPLGVDTHALSKALGQRGRLRQHLHAQKPPSSSVTIHLSEAASQRARAANVKRRKELVKLEQCIPKMVVMGFQEKPPLRFVEASWPGVAARIPAAAGCAEPLGILSEILRPVSKRQLQRDTAPKAHSVVSSMSSKASSVSCGKSPQRYKALDHLLPTIRTVRLGA